MLGGKKKSRCLKKFIYETINPVVLKQSSKSINSLSPWRSLLSPSEREGTAGKIKASTIPSKSRTIHCAQSAFLERKMLVCSKANEVYMPQNNNWEVRKCPKLCQLGSAIIQDSPLTVTGNTRWTKLLKSQVIDTYPESSQKTALDMNRQLKVFS